MRLPFLCFTIVFLLFPLAEGTVVQFSCGGVIGSTSQQNILPLWSSQRQRATLQTSIGYFATLKGSSVLSKAVIEEETSQKEEFATIFEGGDFNALNREICQLYLELPHISDNNVEAGIARLLVSLHESELCFMPNITFKSASFSKTISQSTNDKAFSLHLLEKDDLPVTISFDSNCIITLLISTTQWGTLYNIYTWLPLVVYSCATGGLLFVYIFFNSCRSSFLMRCVVLLALFCGFVGATTGFTLELSLWYSTGGLSFPFPIAVLFFLLFSVAYSFAFVGCALLSPYKSVMFICALRMLTFGVVISMGVAFFAAGFVLLGLIACGQIVLSNAAVSLHYSYSIFNIYRMKLINLTALRSSHVWGTMWFPLSALFGPVFIMWYMVENHCAKKGNESVMVAIRERAHFFLRFFLLQNSFILLVIHNIGAIALSTVASYTHQTFSALLSLVLIITSVQILAILWVSFNLYTYSQSEHGIITFFWCGTPTISSVEISTAGIVKPNNQSPCNDFRPKQNELNDDLEAEEEYWPTSVERVDNI